MNSACADRQRPRRGRPTRVMPAHEEIDMAKGYCPECSELHEITVTDRPVGRTGTAMRWRVVVHRKPGADPKLCDGSGQLI